MSTEGVVEKTRGALVILKPQVLQTRLKEALREDARA
jgi:CRP/FNR family cyclic AMP-dependent transcriptional regulator